MVTDWSRTTRVGGWIAPADEFGNILATTYLERNTAPPETYGRFHPTKIINPLDNWIPALSTGPFVATRTGLRIEGDPSPNAFRAYLCAMLSVTEHILWVVGDAILWGERHCPEVVDEVIESGRYQRRTLSTARWVASHVRREERHAELSWSHHEAVASLEPQEQAILLDAAEREGWTRDELRDAVREVRGETVDVFREELREARRALDRLLGVADTNRRIDGVRLAIAAIEDLEVLDAN